MQWEDKRNLSFTLIRLLKKKKAMCKESNSRLNALAGIMKTEAEDEQVKGAKIEVYKRIRQGLNKYLVQGKMFQDRIALQPEAAKQI